MKTKTFPLIALLLSFVLFAPVQAQNGPASVTIAGDWQDEAGCPADWQPECAVTQLAFDEEDGVWQGEFELPAGAYNYKAALDGGWDENYGLAAEADGANIPLALADDATVKFYYNDDTHWVTDNQSAVIATVAGSFQAALGCESGGDNGNWDPTCLRSWLQDPDGDGIYSFSTSDLPAGDYEAKVAIDEGWDENYGLAGEPGGDNIAFSVPDDGRQLDFFYDAASHVLTIIAAEPVDLVADANLVQPALQHPIQDSVFYFVLPDRFNNGDPDNDRAGLTPDDPTVHGFDPTHKGFYHGGDLAGLLEQMDYLEELGVTAIWMAPVLKNQPYQPNSGDAGYHGYWITDFTQFDPHFGTNAELVDVIEEAHSRGIKIFFDIITNHTADVIQYEEGEYGYRSKKEFPYRDASGEPFDDRAYAGTGDFPELDPETSFPYTPTFAEPEDADIKVPDWLNNPIYYHNRGDSTFIDENSLYGDFFRLDDLFTEHPDVVEGMIDIYKSWVELGVDGFRVDTVKHVNLTFWQQFVPAILAHAEAEGNPDFFIFGEVFSGDGTLLSHYTTSGQMPAVLDFGFQSTVRSYVSQVGPADGLRQFFEADDRFTDADSNAYRLPTFIGNHDMGRFGLFLLQDGTPEDDLLARDQLGHALMFFSRGMPVVYYGDEQGFTGDGNDQAAREDMFPSQVESYNDNPLIGSEATTAEDNFDPEHPLYQTISQLAAIRSEHPALQRGAQIHRVAADSPGVYAFSRIEREERVEYVLAFNNITQTQTATVPTFYGEGVEFEPVYPDEAEPVTTDSDGQLTLSVPAIGFVIYQAGEALPAYDSAPGITIATPQSGQTALLPVNTIDGNQVLQRLEVRAELSEPIFGEVTFAVKVGEGDYEPIGTDDNPPYRVLYNATPLRGLAEVPPLSFKAIVSNLSETNDITATINSAEVSGITIQIQEPAQLDTSLKYAIIHYQREADDYDDWGLLAAGEGLADSVSPDAPLPFLGETGFGRFAFIPVADPSQPIDLTLQQGDDSGSAIEFSLVPDESPEVWLVEEDGSPYLSQAEAQDYVAVHYQNEAGDYAAVTLDASVDGEFVEEALAPEEEDDFGAVFYIEGLADYAAPLEISLSDGGALVATHTFTPTETAAAWLVEGDDALYASQDAADGTVTIHYHRPDGDYGDPTSSDFNDYWGLHTFGGAADPGWETPRTPAGEDAFGIYFTVPVDEGADGFGYIIHRGPVKDPAYAGEGGEGPNMAIDIPTYGHEVWHIQTEYESRAAFNPDNPPPYVYPVTGKPAGAAEDGD